MKYWIDVNSNIDVSVILKEKKECGVMCLLSHRYVRMRVMREEVELVQRAGMVASHQKSKHCFNLYTSSVLCIMNANVC